MNRRDLLRTALLAGAGAWVAPQHVFARERATRMVIYKTPTCGCCTKWVDHVKAAGFDTVVRDMDDVTGIKRNYGVPAGLYSCHTALVEGYVIEGHVPADLIRKLIAEKANVIGIAVGGMPQGTPGMETGVKEKYDVVAWEKGGKTRLYAKR